MRLIIVASLLLAAAPCVCAPFVRCGVRRQQTHHVDRRDYQHSVDESSLLFFIDVKDQNGNVANWKFEGYPPVVLNRVGWKKTETMLPGDTVIVFGWQARDGTNWAHSRFVTFAKNGKKLESGPPAGNGDGGNKRPAVAP